MERKHLHNEINNELESLSPLLAKHLKKEVTKDDVPFRYFEKLPAQVLQKITEEKTANSTIIDRIYAWFYNPNYKLAFASVIFLVVATGLINYYTKTKATAPLDLASITFEEASKYLIDHAYDLESDQLDLLQSSVNDDIWDVNEEELKPVLEEYLYQMNPDDLN